MIIDPKTELEIPDDLNIPLKLQTIISKALEKDIKARYQTADDMLEDIKQFLLYHDYLDHDRCFID